jgi:hypothetical protein
LGGQGVDRNKLTKVLGFVFPTVALLSGADKDLPAGFGFAKCLQPVAVNASPGAVDPYGMCIFTILRRLLPR